MAVWEKAKSVLPWLPTHVWQRCVSQLTDIRPLHLVIGVANHFEPMNQTEAPGKPVDHREQEQRVKKWCRDYPPAVGAWRDNEGQPLRHTYFYPAEDYDCALIDRLAEHCHAGWGEIEIHLHHGVETPDTPENTSRALIKFRDALEARGCLSRQDSAGPPRYGFVHGNWALANSDHGRFCGVDERKCKSWQKPGAMPTARFRRHHLTHKSGRSTHCTSALCPSISASTPSSGLRLAVRPFSQHFSTDHSGTAHDRL